MAVKQKKLKAMKEKSSGFMLPLSKMAMDNPKKNT